MAVEVALGLLGPVIELGKLVARPIRRQFNYLCCFTSNIGSLKDEAKKLDDASKGLDEEVKRKSNNLEEPVGEVKTWIQNSKKIKEEINGILSEATSAESGCLKLGARFSLSKRAKKTTDSTRLILGQKPKAEFQSGPIVATQAVQLGKIFECESRKKIEEGIMTTLRDGDVNMIGISGMGGLGKTTMAEKIMNRVLDEGLFDEVVLAVVKQKVQMSTIQDDIGRPLGLEKLKEENSENLRKQMLYARLSDTKRTLLVLDDVWEKLELRDFGIPYDSKACRILLTSRDKDVFDLMQVQQIFGMEILPEEEAWSFFRAIVGTCVDKTNLNSIAKEVVKKCSGLTIALKVVGEALRNRDKASIWKDALRDMERCNPNGVMKKVYTPLRWSYDFLSLEDEGLYLQYVFLVCCLFPEDAEIPLEYLTYFCMGLDIFEGITEMEDARNKMAKLVEILKSRSLLLNGEDEDHVRMHDVVRDVCIYIAKEKGYIGGNDCTWISSSQLVGNRNELISGSRFSNLHLLFLSHRYDSLGFKFDGAYMEEIREIYVLCIEDYSFTKLPYPTQSFETLKTLILDSCEQLETISIVGELVHLEILVIRNCSWIEELPSEMKVLDRLKLLELTGCWKLQSIGRGIISSLVQLEELKMRNSFSEWGYEDRENAVLREFEALKNLTCLEIEIADPAFAAENMLLSSKIERFCITVGDNQFEPSKFNKEIRLLRLEGEVRLGDWIEMQFMRTAECLRLSVNVDLGRGDNIKWLELEKCKSVKNVVRTSIFDDAPMFPSIEHLKLFKIPQLEEICDGPISSCSFEKLKQLKIQNCEALMNFWRSNNLRQNNSVPLFTNLSSIWIDNCHCLHNLGQLSIAGNDCLPQLEDLHIERCDMMEQVFLWNDESKNSIGSQQNRHVTKVFPKLKKMNLYDLPNLTTFYKGIEGIEFPLPMEMTIRECPNMKSIIRSSKNAEIDHHFSHLFCQSKELQLAFGSHEVLDVAHNHNPLSRHAIRPSLFNGLEVLGICKYESSKSVFTHSTAVNLVSLRELYISECDEMMKVIEDEDVACGGERILLFPKLEKLLLEDLPKLVSFCGLKCEVEFPSLRKVKIASCPCILQEEFSFGVAPNLEVFETDLSTYVGVGIGVRKLNDTLQLVPFHSLKKLRINSNYHPFYDHKIYVSLFTGLEKLRLYRFKGGMMRLFSCSVAENLVNLRELQIHICYGILVNVIEDVKVIADDHEKVTSTIVLFPKLEELSLDRLPYLVSFCEWKCNVELPSLTTVRIEECPNMERFSSGFLATPNLETAEIECQNAYIGPAKDLNRTLHQDYLVRKKEPFDSLIQIGVHYNPFHGHEIPSSVCDGLDVLKISSYEGRLSFFTLSMARNLVGLRELHVRECDEMITVIEDEDQVASGSGERILIFPKLEKLVLEDLPKLVSFCESKCEVELPSLRELAILRCPNMEKMSLGVVAAPDLEVIKIDDKNIDGVQELNGALQQAGEKVCS